MIIDNKRIRNVKKINEIIGASWNYTDDLSIEQITSLVVHGRMKLLVMADIMRLCGISRSTLDRLVKGNLYNFPNPDYNFGRSPRWSEYTICKWMHARSKTVSFSHI